MQAVIWGGAVLTLIGVAGLAWCIRLSLNVRNAGQDAEAARAALQKVLAWNMAALGLAAIGLMMVVLGIILR